MDRETSLSLKSIAGQKTYSGWVDMLKKLVATSRTHPLAPMIAGMMQYIDGPCNYRTTAWSNQDNKFAIFI